MFPRRIHNPREYTSSGPNQSSWTSDCGDCGGMHSRDSENAVEAILPRCRQILAAVLLVDFQVGDFEPCGSFEQSVPLPVHQGFVASFRVDGPFARALLLGFARLMNVARLAT